MSDIRPISDLRNNFKEISKKVHETNEPIYLTKNGYGDMVVMSIEAYENMQLENEIYTKLIESEREAEQSGIMYTAEEILERIDKVASNLKLDE